MRITALSVQIMNEECQYHGLMAVANATFDDQFLVRSLKIILVENNLQIAMPNETPMQRCRYCHRKTLSFAPHCAWCRKCQTTQSRSHREYRETVHPVNMPFRAYLERLLLQAFNHTLETGSMERLYFRVEKNEELTLTTLEELQALPVLTDSMDALDTSIPPREL